MCPRGAVVDDEFDRRAAFDSVKDDAFDIISGRRRLEAVRHAEGSLPQEGTRAHARALNLSEGEYLSDALAEEGQGDPRHAASSPYVA